MSALRGFMSTWSQARTTFGEGVPEPGATFDSSTALLQLEAETRAAAAGSLWSGGAADTYNAKNATHARNLAQMADLDQRIGVEVDRSAVVVARGRRQLDSVKDWVVAAAASVPKNAVGEQMLLPIVAKGTTEVADIVTSSNGELISIAERIRRLGAEYATLRRTPRVHEF